VVLGLASPAEKISELKKDTERYDRLILRYTILLNRQLKCKTDMEQGVEANAVTEKRKAALLEKRVNVVPLCNIKSHFVSIDSEIPYGIITEICPVFDVSNKEFTDENQETYWKKNIFDSKRLRTSKKKEFTGMIESDAIAMRVHYRRLKADRPVLSSLPSLAKREENKEASPTTQEVHENHFVVGAGPGNTNIRTITTRNCGDDGIDDNLRQKTHACFKAFKNEILPRIRCDECKEEKWGVERRIERAPGSDQPGDGPGSGLSRFSGVYGSSCCSLRGAVGGVYKAPVGSVVYESTRWEAACVHEFFQ